LLTEIANEAHVKDWHDLRWFAVGGDNPRAIVILRRGANKKSVKTISAKLDPAAWESWKPVLADLKAEKQKTNKRRVSHKKLKTGRM
jgi:hypothetical protein